MSKRYYQSKESKIDLDTLFNMFLSAWSADTCAPRLREVWSKDNPTAGQCSITSFIIQDMYGGEVYGVPLEGGGCHAFNYIDGVMFDLACEQFHGEKLEYTLNYPQFREEHFKDSDKKARYELLKSKVIK